jgi:predicted secreted protein
MPSNSVVGYAATMETSTDGVTYAKCAELVNYKLKPGADNLDATSHDSGGQKDRIQGLKDWTADIDTFYIAADTSQLAIYNSYVNGTPLYYRFRPKVASGKEQWVGTALVKSWEQDAPTNDLVKLTISLEGTAGQALTKSTQ